ncbi:hypothetical protein CR513_38264, partial [Mucuna pruriens]
MNRSMIDAASGGALMDKTPTTARQLISNMASNTQQFGIRGTSKARMVSGISAVDNPRLENQLTELTSLWNTPLTCATRYKTQSRTNENVGAIGGYQYEKQPY